MCSDRVDRAAVGHHRKVGLFTPELHQPDPTWSGTEMFSHDVLKFDLSKWSVDGLPISYRHVLPVVSIPVTPSCATYK